MARAMSDDVVASSSSPAHEPSDNRRAADNSADALPPASDSPAQRRKAGLTRKFQFMTHLMTNLDALVYAELCTLYYMDCSFFRLLIRLVVQSFFLSPKSDEFVMLMPTHRPHVVAILVPNALCMLLHLFSSLPQASETTRGYLHGGIIIDFIGQKAPTSRLALLVLDLAVLGLQCIMLSVHGEREVLRKFVNPGARVVGSASSEGATTTTTTGTSGLAASLLNPRPPPTTEDLEAEERGVPRRTGRNAADATDDIELQPLRPRGTAGEGSTHGHRRPDFRDYMISGNASLGSFHVLHSITAAPDDYQTAAAQSLQTIGYAARLARLAAEPTSRTARLATQRRPQQ